MAWGTAVGAACTESTRVVIHVVVKVANDWSMNLASMMAYTLITAIFSHPARGAQPRRVCAAPHGLWPYPGCRRRDRARLPARDHRHYRPPRAARRRPALLAVASLVGLLWLGPNLCATMENAFSIIFRIRGRALEPQRLIALGMVLLLALLLPLSLGAASLVTAGSDWFDRFVPKSVGVVLSYVGPLTSLGVLWLLFLAIYMIVPNVAVRLAQAWRGALAAALLVGVLELLFPLYVQLFLSPNSRYGAAAAALLVVIIWLWFFAVITVVGAQINAVFMGLGATTFDLSRTVELAYAQQNPAVEQKRTTTPPRFKRRWARGLWRWTRRKATVTERPSGRA